MPSLDENIDYWDKDYDWKSEGEEWSEGWGGSDQQWKKAIFPRIKEYDLSGTILEIAPGFGRWADYIKGFPNKYIGVDISEKCINACATRFKDYEHMSFFVNDGRSLDCVNNESIDFIFSYDSLVHADSDVMSNYLSEIALKLKQDGVAFIHHSNLGAYSLYSKLRPKNELLKKKFDFIVASTSLDDVWSQWRATSVSAKFIAKVADMNGLQCINQELVTWSTDHILVDCMSTIVRSDSQLVKENLIIKNRKFMVEAEHSRLLANAVKHFKKQKLNKNR